MKPVPPKTFPKRFLNQRSKPAIKDPIEVYCRIRPLLNHNEHTCIYPKDRETVVMVPPNTIVNAKATKEVHYSFQHVFKEDDSQKDVFDHSTLPLIKDLLQGVSGLIFTYGITSSGKTFTMTGNPRESGILPKCLDVIFNSLQGCIASKFVFKPDKLNGFDVQTMAEAVLDLNKETVAAGRTKTKRKEYLGEWSTRIPESTVVSDVNTGSSYALFVSYVEIYNNCIYDLLEDIPPKASMKPKNLRMDSLNNKYVFGTTEIEVKSANEALEAFAKGKQRRHIAATALNAESSRSHSVFTVRVAQAPLDDRSVEVLQDNNVLTVSQLSMVDLAGSERSQRTENEGSKLQEAGKINNSLMALRNCIETLRENQVQGGTKPIPYRNYKLTELLKSYFEGESKIRMLVCVNPTVADFNETTYVMKFAAMAQEILISRATPVTTPVSCNMKAGRGNLYRTALQRDKEANTVVACNLLEPVDDPEFPPLLVGDSESDLKNLVGFLETRRSRRIILNQGLRQRQEEFRKQLTQVDKENMSLKQENAVMHQDLKAREKQVNNLEGTLSSTEDVLNSLRHKHATFDRQFEAMKQKLNEKDRLLSESEKEKKNMEIRKQSQIELVKGRAKRLLEKTLVTKQAEHEAQMCTMEEKLRHLREILNSDNSEIRDLPPPEKRPDIRMTRAKTTLVKLPRSVPVAKPAKSNSEPRVDQIEDTAPTTATQYKSIAVSNPRHRRSQSSSGGVWLDHKPVGSLDLGTVCQPKMKKRISVSKLEVKDVVQNDVSKYILTHQEQDSRGEVETQLYKGDVIPSAGGGAQVIFHDIEKLRQESPPRGYSLRKRSAENLVHRDIETKCAIAVECHGVPSKVLKKSG